MDPCLASGRLEAINVSRGRAEGHPISAGSVGENLTISGLDWILVVPGCELVVGPARLLVTSYARVLEPGWASVGDGVHLVVAGRGGSHFREE